MQESKPNSKPNKFIVRKNKLKWIILIIIILLSYYTISSLNIEEFRDKVSEMGNLAPIGIFMLRSISIIFPAFPSTPYSLLAGALLGFKKGVLVICTSDFFSCAICFTIARSYGRQIVRRIVGQKFMYKVETISKRHLENNIFLMTGFLMTGLFDFISYGIGLTNTPWSKFFPALFLSILLSNPPVVALGAGILDGGMKILIFALIAIFVLSIISNKLLKHKQ